MNESEEIWQFSPEGFIDNDIVLLVSNKGCVKFIETDVLLPITNVFGNYNTDGNYAGIKVNGKDYYLHRLVYMSFHPDDYKTKGRVQFKKFKQEMLNEKGMYRCYLEDLIFIKQSSISQEEVASKLNKNMLEGIHPEYGVFIFNQWIPLHTHVYNNTLNKHMTRLNSDYEIMILDDMINPYLIRNIKTQKLITIHGTTDRYVNITYDKVAKNSLLTHILLASVFPEVDPEETVDHIDNNANNNHITNLMWMSSTNNAKKGQEKSLNIERNGVNVKMLSGLKGGIKTVVREFKSVNAAAEFIHKEKGLTSKLGTVWSKIRRAIQNFDKNYTAYGYFWQEIEKDEPIFPDVEIWKPFTKGCSKYEVSNYGRLKNTYGITLGQKLRGRKYRQANITIERISDTTYSCDHYYIHRLVWEAFNGPIPKGMIILHDEKAPLDKEGCYRNWLEDLKLGTRSQNNFEHHEAVKTLTKQI